MMMRSDKKSLVCVLLLLSTIVGLAADAASGTIIDARFHPKDYTSLGSLNLNSGAITFDTDTLAVSGAFSGTGVLASTQSGTQVAIFDFDGIKLGSGVTVNFTGPRPVVLLSRGGISLDTTLSVGGADGLADASQAAGRLGGFAGGQAQTATGPDNGPGRGILGTIASYEAGGGAGFGGAGGDGGVYWLYAGSPQGGTTYGDAALTDLLGGSGGAGSAGAGQNSGGGAGGGAIELAALGSITILSNGSILANGGKGGGHSPGVGLDGNTGGGGGSGGSILLVATGGFQNQGLIAANGGAGDGITVGGGGGGGGRVAVYAPGFSPVLGTVQANGGPGGPGDGVGSDRGAAGASGTAYLPTDTFRRYMVSGVQTANDDANPHNYDSGLTTVNQNQYVWFDFSATLDSLPPVGAILSAKLSWTGTAYGTIPYIATTVDTDLGVFAVPDGNHGIDTIFSEGLTGTTNVDFYESHLGDLVSSFTIPGGGADQTVSAEWNITSLVNQWLANPGNPLRGQLVIVNRAHPMWVDWNGTLPTLSIEYIPEPSTLVLAGLGLVGLCLFGGRRRKRCG